MYKLYPVKNYKTPLSLRETQRAIKMTKDLFQNSLSAALSLDRVTAPLIVTADSGLNDDLNGVERKVSFSVKEIEGTAEIVQSLAKWKRMALYRYGYTAGTGLYTDMNAVRRDDSVDNLHSIYVDQWDWERVITREERNLAFLKETVCKIAAALAETKKKVNAAFPALRYEISPDVYFITTEELLQRYPDKTPKERENLLLREHKTVFLMEIGDALSNGERHDGRAPDYDDWHLNGDLLVYNPILDCAFEVSSMGIRVDAATLSRQLTLANAENRMCFPYHKMIASNTLPLTIGGGIGQSRLCMLILEKAHIGEVQCSIWPADMVAAAKEAGIDIL